MIQVTCSLSYFKMLGVIFIKDTVEGNPNQPADIPSR